MKQYHIFSNVKDGSSDLTLLGRFVSDTDATAIECERDTLLWKVSELTEDLDACKSENEALKSSARAATERHIKMLRTERQTHRSLEDRLESLERQYRRLMNKEAT